MAKIVSLTDKEGKQVYPQSVTPAIADYTRKLKLDDTLNDLEAAELKKGTDGDYVTTTISAKNTTVGTDYNLDQTIGVSVKILDIATATAGSEAEGVEGEEGYKPAVPAALGLVEASNLKSYIDNVVMSEAEYTVDEDNKEIKSGTTTYELKIDNETNKISIVPYTSIGLSITGNVAYEIDATTTSRTITATVTGSNAATATITWSGSDSGTTTGTGSTMTQTFASATSSTLNASATDGKTTATAKTTVSWNPRVMWLASTDGSLTSIDVTANNTVGGYAVQSGVKIDNKKVTLSEVGYIYFAVVGTPANYYLSNSDDKAALAGGFKKIGTFTKYTSSTKTYNLYRSTDPQLAGTYRIDVV